MSDQKRSTVGEPIWVESVLTNEEYAAAAKKFPAAFSNGSKLVQFDPKHHLDGKWRAGMGKTSTEAEIKEYNRKIEKLHELMRTKKFQRRPEYGTHNEAKP